MKQIRHGFNFTLKILCKSNNSSIGNEMKRRMVKYLLDNNSKLSILIDESSIKSEISNDPEGFN